MYFLLFSSFHLSDGLDWWKTKELQTFIGCCSEDTLSYCHAIDHGTSVLQNSPHHLPPTHCKAPPLLLPGNCNLWMALETVVPAGSGKWQSSGDLKRRPPGVVNRLPDFMVVQNSPEGWQTQIAKDAFWLLSRSRDALFLGGCMLASIYFYSTE